MICHKFDNNSVELVVEFLKNNKVVIIPTDTVYGFSAIACSDLNQNVQNQDKIRQIKGRSENKPFIHLISNPEDIFNYTNQKISNKVLKCWPGPLTVIVSDKDDEKRTIALRCPNDDWLRRIISLCNNAIFSTSVNLSGCDVLEDEQSIVETFGSKADLIVLDGDKKGGVPSTIIKIIDNSFEVIRQGSMKLDID